MLSQVQRDSKGRFTHGNTIAYSGWLGLVNKRFQGDYGIAREYVRQLGRYSYGKMCDSPVSTPAMIWRKYHIFYHPGSPEQFAQQYSQRLDFNMNDVTELAF